MAPIKSIYSNLSTNSLKVICKASFGSAFGFLQGIGKSLMLPVSILPVAGLLLGIGGAFLGGIERGAIVIESQWLIILFQIMKNSGEPIFATLPLIFAIGVALGVSKNDGVAALASVVGFVVLLGTLGVLATLQGLKTTSILGIASMDTGVFGGILIGLLAGLLFNRYYKINLPSYLGFFSGKRFVPIVTAFSAIALGILLSLVWPPVQSVIDRFSDYVVSGNPSLALFFYGVVERALLPFGLHHIWNVPFFFEIGEFVNSSGQTITGEMSRFFAGDPAAGNLGGGYLFKMFGLPAAAIAIWRTAEPKNRNNIKNIMLSAALTSFLTGITEPIEFAFLFVAPMLYVVHALLAGCSFVLLHALDAKLGYTFSHGFIDYVLFFAMGTKAWLVLALAPVYFGTYFYVFKFVITKFDLKTPGRETSPDVSSNTSLINPKPFQNSNTASLTDKAKFPPPTNQPNQPIPVTEEDQKTIAILNALGGFANIIDIDACITRLRINVKDTTAIDKTKLQTLGAAGVLVLGKSVQAIFGTQSELLKTKILELKQLDLTPKAATLTTANAKLDAALELTELSHDEIIRKLDPSYLEKLWVAIGGKKNIISLTPCSSTRLRIQVRENSITSGSKMDQINGVYIAKNIWHLLVV